MSVQFRSDFKIEGLEALLGKLNEVAQDVQFKSGRAALRAAANFIAGKARENYAKTDDAATAPNIPANIAVRFNARSSRRTGNLHMRIGVLGGAKQYANTKSNVRKGKAGKTYKTAGSKTNPGGDTWYWRFIEFGTRRTRPRRFLRDAMKQHQNEATRIFVSTWSRGIDRAVKRAKKAKSMNG